MIKPDALRTLSLDIADKLDEFAAGRLQIRWASHAQRLLAKAQESVRKLSNNGR